MNRSFTLIGLSLLAGCIGLRSLAADEPASKPISEEERSHWSFQPIKKPAKPEVKRPDWVRNPIDSFILSDLEAVDLSPSPEADRPTLLRRLSFDLTGLPPTTEEIDRFVADKSPDAYEKQVDRLLKSPGFGVRQAQHWLDLARYADTDGFEFDQARPNAWRYRDWVVEAFNRDMPYDRFIAEQLAGDELAPDAPASFIATGFNRCYPDMVDLNDQALRRQNALNDITDTTGLVFLGLTVGCARCHDHRTDPIRQTDYYRLQAVFTPARFRDDYPIGSSGDRKAYDRATAEHRRRVAAIQAELLAIEDPVRAALTPNPAGAVQDDIIAAMRKKPEERSPEEVALVYELWAKDKRIKPAAWAERLGTQRNAQRERLLKQLNQVKAEAPPALSLARGIDETGKNAGPTHVLIRGEFTRKGATVEPGVPIVLPEIGFKPQPGATTTGRRTALARWLASPKNPLPARVAVNRIWQTHFGRGIVATPSDFGKSGVGPTHPELLDHLASALIENGWSLKSIHRLIVLSNAYRQSSLSRPDAAKVDAENSLFWRQNRRRLDGEAIRDAVLAVSGKLNTELGGPPVFPELPPELTKLSSKGEVWPVSKRESDRDKRSLYVFVRRNLRYPFFEVFDRPDTNASCPKRPVSTIAPQALTLFNGKFAQDLASVFARRLESTASDPLERARLGFKTALGREPNADELKLSAEFLAHPGPNRTADFALAILNSNEFIYID